MVEAFAKSLVTPKIDPEPTAPLPTVKIDLKQLPQSNNILIWLGHSSFYIQLSGKRILIDPVLSDYASPGVLRPLKEHIFMILKTSRI